jgi:AraC-like DNA-binding protein
VISEHVHWRPPAPLRALVAGASGYRQVGVAPGRHRGLPSPYLTLIVTLDEPLVVAAHPDPRAPGGSYDTLVGGLHTTPALLVHDGRQSGIQLSVTPAGARCLLGLPAGELAGADLDATDVLPWAGELRERVGAAGGWPARFAALEAVLRRYAEPAAMPPEVAWTWQRVLDSHGTLPVSGLAGESGWSDRYLRRRFRAEIGLGIKEAARVARFDRARRLLGYAAVIGRPLPLAELAAGCGYSDQPHLAREFRALAGCPPSRWLADEFRNVQATDLALIQHWPDDRQDSTAAGLAHAAGA